MRGPTFSFAGPIRTAVDLNKWTLAGAALVMQPDREGTAALGVWVCAVSVWVK